MLQILRPLVELMMTSWWFDVNGTYDSAKENFKLIGKFTGVKKG